MKAFRSSSRAGVALCAAGVALALSAGVNAQVRVAVTNLVTDDQAAHAAQITDGALVNAWGLSYSPTSPFWASSNGMDLATLYSVSPATQATSKVGLTVTVPVGGVTGQVFNSGSSSGAFNGDNFLFVGESGGIAGWRGALGTTAEMLQLPSTDNVYKGAAFATLSGNSYLLAANFRSGNIDILKGANGEPDLAGKFTDPGLPNGYAPFNIQTLGGTVYVAYALQDGAKRDELAGAGRGFVSSFSLQGNFIARIASAGALDAPWGLAIAPASFGALAGSLLVGNFGDGRISAYDPNSHAFLGQLAALDGTPLSIDGLWALAPGNGGGAGSSALLYFTAGPDDESHGILGVLSPQITAAVPEPATMLMLLPGLAAIGAIARRRRAA
jgi:uncharacterized protein (TIGR03118 family)